MARSNLPMAPLATVIAEAIVAADSVLEANPDRLPVRSVVSSYSDGLSSVHAHLIRNS